MLFRVLRGICIDEGDKTTSITAPRQRALLALLTLNAGRVVSRPLLADGIWGDAQPLHADAALQVVKSRLVRAIGPAGERILSEAAGYRLDVGPDESDVARVEALLRKGRAALAANDETHAAAAFEDALSFFGSEPLEDVADFPFRDDAARRLVELRVTIYEARNNAYLAAGRHLEVLADIEELVQDQPLREHLRAQQITALYRSGRQSDALAAAGELRKILRDELGVDPSPGIQELELRVLDQDPALLATNARLVAGLPPWTSETLPFVGRDAEREVAMDAMRRACASGVHLLVVTGARGFGKSRFLLEMARQVGTDAVVVPVDVHEALRPSIEALADAMSRASARISPDERALIHRSIDGGEIGDPKDWPIEVLHARAASWLAALSAKAPVLLLVDDLHRAGPALLDVIGQLATSVQPKRVFVLASAAATHSPRVSAVDRLVSLMKARGQADCVEIGSLGEDDLDDLLGRMRIAPRRKIVARLLDLTGGNPFMVGELLSSGSPERIPEMWTVPPQIRDVVLARTDELGRGAIDVLQWAAIFGFDFDKARLAEISQIEEPIVATMVERAVAAHILLPSGACTYRFEHELVRRTLIDELSETDRAGAHARVAMALEGGDTRPSGLAWHWAQSHAPEAAEQTLRHARAAGDDAMRVYEPHTAARWYQVALEQNPSPKDRGELLVSLAEAQQYAGNLEFVDVLREAMKLAQEHDDDALVVKIVNSASPGATVLPGFSPEEVVPILKRAIAIAPNDATRSRAIARLATDEQLRDPAGAESMMREAIALARASGDITAVVDTLLRHASIGLAPSSLATRHREVEEALALAIGCNDLISQFALHGLRVTTAIQRGDIVQADASSEIAARIAAQHDLSLLRWSVKNRRAWRAGLAADLEEAERLISDTRRFGHDHGIMHAEHNAGLQFAALRWQEGRAADFLAQPVTIPEQFAQLPGLRLGRARVLATGRESSEDARAILSEFAARGFEQLPETPLWSAMLIVTAETALILRMPEAARAIFDLLAPYTDQVAFTGNWVAAPIAYGAAIAASLSSCTDADGLFEHAITVAERIDAPLLRARAQLAWVYATRMNQAPRRRAHASTLCNDAAETAERLRLLDLAEFARRLGATC